jgi:hypothetical protein
MDSSKLAVIDRLKAYNNRFESLLQIANMRPITRDARALSAESIRALKCDLDHDYRSLITGARYGTLSQEELAFLLPAIEQAFADLHIRNDADPSSKVFFDTLQTARRGIRFTLAQLDSSQPFSSQRIPRAIKHLLPSPGLLSRIRTFTSSLAFRCGLYFLACHRYLHTKPAAPAPQPRVQ